MHDPQLVSKLNAFFVNGYKVVGFGVLGFILFGLVSYLGVHAFFFASESWAAPTVVSPTDDRVLALGGRMAEYGAARDALLARRAELELLREQAVRVAEAQAAFRERFREALSAERGARRRELSRLAELRAAFEAERDEILESNRAFAALARTRADELREASMIEREGFLTTNHQLAQLAQGNLQLAGRDAELDAQLARLRRDVAGLDAAVARIGGQPAAGSAASVETLRLEQAYTEASLAHARAEDERKRSEAAIAALDDAVARYDELLASVRASPLLRSLHERLTIAFVPYENLEQAEPGAALYGCSVGLVLCREVGAVRASLPGEVQVRHPVRNRMLRGVMVEIALHDESWAREDVLHLGGAPLLF